MSQPRVLRVAAIGHVLALAALLVAAGRDAPGWVLAACATAAGLCLPQLPAAMRSLWATLVRDAPSRQAAYALGAIVFEVAVMIAPALVAAIVAVASPAAAVAVAAAVGGSAAFAFAATAGSRAWRGTPHSVGWLGPLVAPGMRTLFAVMVAFGAAIGIVQVAVPAFAESHGTPATAGLLLAAVSFGSLAGGVVYGARDWPGAPPRRLVVLLVVLGAFYALLAAAATPWALGGLLVLAGLLIAPTNVVSSTLLDTVAPPGTVTEAFAVTVMAIVTGIAVGNAAGGLIVDAASWAVAVLCSASAALLAAATALVRRRSLTARIAPEGR